MCIKFLLQCLNIVWFHKWWSLSSSSSPFFSYTDFLIFLSFFPHRLASSNVSTRKWWRKQMDKLLQKMGHQNPKLPNKKLSPVLFGTYFLMRGFLALLLSLKLGLRGKKCSTLGRYSLFAQSVLLGKGHLSCQGSNWKPQDKILAMPHKGLGIST